MAASLLNFSSSQLDKCFVPEMERTSKPRFDSLGLNSNEKPRLEINCPGFDKILEINTHAESKRLEPNTHQQVSNFEKRLDGHLNHIEKGRMEGVPLEKNIHFEKNTLLDKSRLDSVHLEKTRVDGISVHMLDNMPLQSHLDKRTLDIVSGFDKCSKDSKIDKCLENSVHASVSLDKRKDCHHTAVMDKGRTERESSLTHAPVSTSILNTSIPNPGPLPSHLHASSLSNNPVHQPVIHPASNSISHKPVHSSHIYQNSIRAHLHNPGLPSHNGTPQFPSKKPLVLHGPNVPSSVRPSNMSVASSVPSTATSVSPVISIPNSIPSTISLPLSNPGISSNLSATLSLSNSGAAPNTVPAILQQPTLHSVSHLSNQRTGNESIMPPRPDNSPQAGGGSLRSQNDSIQSGPRANTPLAQHQVLAPNHSASHVGSQAIHVRVTPPEISSPSSTATSTIVTSNISISTNSDLPVTSSINSHSAISLHGGTHSGGGLINHGGAQGSGSPGLHSGYSLPLSGAPFSGYAPLYGPYSSNLQHPPYLPPRVEPPVIIH